MVKLPAKLLMVRVMARLPTVGIVDLAYDNSERIWYTEVSDTGLAAEDKEKAIDDLIRSLPELIGSLVDEDEPVKEDG
jgi:hypothetical protein